MPAMKELPNPDDICGFDFEHDPFCIKCFGGNPMKAKGIKVKEAWNPKTKIPTKCTICGYALTEVE